MKKIIALIVAMATITSQIGAMTIVNASGETDSPITFAEDFSTYTATDGTTVTEAYALHNGEKTIAEHSSGAKWVTSDGITTSSSMPVYAHIDTANGQMVLNSAGTWLDVVNLDWSDAGTTIDEIKGLSFKTKYDSTSRIAGMRMFVSSDEKSYLLFMKASNEFSWNGTEAGVNAAGPRVILYQNGVGTLLSTTDTTLGTTYTDTDGVWRYDTNKNPQWDIEITDEGVINWSMVGNADTATGTIDNADVKALIASDWVYPIAAQATGENDVIFDDIFLEYTISNKKIFAEDFSTYTTADGTTVTEAYALHNGEKTIAEHSSGAKWVTSDGITTSSSIPVYAHIDTANGQMVLNSAGTWLDVVNLDWSKADTTIDKIKSLSFKTKYDNTSRIAGMRMFVSGDENSYLLFMKASHEFSWNGAQVGLNSAGPMVILYKDGVGTLLSTTDTTLGTTYTDTDGVWRYDTNKNPQWNIEITDEGVINWSMVGNADTATGTIDNADVKALIASDWVYPIAAQATGENDVIFDDIFLEYNGEEVIFPDFSDDFSTYTATDGVTVTSDYELKNGAKVLAQSADGTQWITSDVHMGGYSNESYAGKAYIDVDTDKLMLKGLGAGWQASVNLKLPNRVESVSEIKFTATRGSSKAVGMNLFVNEAEDNYITFAQKNNETTSGGAKIGEDAEGNAIYADSYVPYVRLCVGSEKTVIAYADADDGWSSADSSVTWDIKHDGGVISWTATGTSGTKWTGTYTDANGLVARCKYLVSAMAVGDGYGNISDVDIWYVADEPLTFEHRNYSFAELAGLYDATVSTEEKQILLSTDLSDVITNTAKASVSVGDVKATTSNKLFGTQVEFSDMYDSFFDEDGNLLSPYITYAQSVEPIPVFRFGGSASTNVNFMSTINGTASTCVSAPSTSTTFVVGEQTKGVMQMGLVEWIKACYANNPDASFIFCVSPYTTTAQDCGNLVHFLTDETGEWAELRIEKGLTSPVKIEYIELGNEIASYTDVETVGSWYTEIAKAQISAIKTANSNVKVMACGTTTFASGWKDWINKINDELGNSIDSISAHTYYYGMTPEQYVGNLNEMKNLINDGIKISITEHAKNWGTMNDFNAGITTSLWGSLANGFYLNKIAKLDYIDMAMQHNLIGSTLWGRWLLLDGEFVAGNIERAYSTMSKNWGDEILHTNVTYTDNSVDSGWSSNDLTMENNFEANAVKDASGNINLVMINQAMYTDMDLSLSIPEGYTLIKETKYTGPNMITCEINKECASLTTVTETEMFENTISSYKMPAKSIVILTFRNTSGASQLSDDFTQYEDVSISGSAPNVLVTNTNGTIWDMSDTNTGYIKMGMQTAYGTATISDDALTVISVGESTMAVNWNVSAVDISDITEISFETVTDSAVSSGVKLFASDDESSNYDFSYALSGLSGTVNWNIAIEGTTLTWVASNSTETKNGTMTISTEDLSSYSYLASVYANGDGGITINNISVIYGATDADLSGFTYKINSNDVSVSVNPDCYDVAVTAYVAFYNLNTLMSVKKVDIIQGEGIQSFDAPMPDLYDEVKLFIWSTQDMTPQEVAIPVE